MIKQIELGELNKKESKQLHLHPFFLKLMDFWYNRYSNIYVYYNEDNKILGLLSARGNYINILYVLEKNRGIGSKLVYYAEQVIKRKKGFNKIITTTSLKECLGFWKRQGYHIKTKILGLYNLRKELN